MASWTARGTGKDQATLLLIAAIRNRRSVPDFGSRRVCFAPTVSMFVASPAKSGTSFVDIGAEVGENLSIHSRLKVFARR